MGLKPFATDGLSGLCSKDQLDLLDSVDCLRSQGISHYVSLPQIIVCGDQSSGKSSVLEAISGVSFPVKSSLCTRFPTELVLRKTSHIGVRVSIVRYHSPSEPEQLSHSSFDEKLDGFEGLPILIESAKEAMGISTHGKAFSKDLLRIEVSGPDRPHLTIVDLPGLIHTETKQQTASDVELIKEVVQAYMKEPRSIILAVVSAKNDIANQIVLKLARTADEAGNRTIGVITKPDTLLAGSESEAMYVSLARNQQVEFRLGWHVLKNMDSEAGESSLEDRDVKEKEFFSHGIWKELSQSLLGVDKLRNRLSKVLLAQIAAELPSLMKEIENKSNACRNRLDKLGEPRATLVEQRLYLLHISQTFQSLVKAAVDGTYNDPFFEDAKTESGYQKRIRAVMQNLNLNFADAITRRGHRHEITDSKSTGRLSQGVVLITRDDFMAQIEDLMRRTRGRELPGTFNPMIVADLFREQAIPWESITRSHIERVWKAAKTFLGLAATHIADTVTSKALFHNIFQPALDQLLDTLNTKTSKLLTPHQNSHPITYNNYFIETYQMVRNERKRSQYAKILKSFFGAASLETSHIRQTTDLRLLLDQLVKGDEPDMNRFACSEALDCMEAYYKVALKRFIDDVAVEVVEAKLISPLINVFSPIAVSAMNSDLVTSIAGESEENRTQREQLTKQLEVLMKGSDTCKRYIDIRLLDSDSTTQSDPRFSGDSVNDETSDTDDGTNGSIQDDASSLRSRSASPEIQTRDYPEIPEEKPAEEWPAEECPSDTVKVCDEVPTEEVTYGFGSVVRKGKKGKIASRRQLFED